MPFPEVIGGSHAVLTEQPSTIHISYSVTEVLMFPRITSKPTYPTFLDYQSRPKWARYAATKSDVARAKLQRQFTTQSRFCPSFTTASFTARQPAVNLLARASQEEYNARLQVSRLVMMTTTRTVHANPALEEEKWGTFSGRSSNSIS